MINQMSLNDAVSKVYGKSLVASKSPMAEWQLFMPFSMHSTNSTILLKLLEVPSYLYTSQEICNKKIEKFQGILHQVNLIFVQRCFQSSYYLLISKDNLIPISSLLKIKKEAGEKVDESVIYDYLEFTSKLQDHPNFNQISFDQDQIAIDPQGRFVLANYLMYFQDFKNDGKKQKQNLQSQQNLRRDIRKLLAKLIMPESQKFDMMNVYSTLEIKYGQKMLKVIEMCMQPSFNSSEIVSYISSIKQSKANESFSATVTDSFIDQCQKVSENIMNDSSKIAIDQSFRKIKAYNRSIKRKKIGAFIIVFIIILVLIGAITFKYLKPRPLDCQDSQYADPDAMKCLNCDLSCQRCSGGGNTMCLSCKGNLFLIMHSETDKTGRCSQDCHGTIIKTKICIDNH